MVKVSATNIIYNIGSEAGAFFCHSRIKSINDTNTKDLSVKNDEIQSLKSRIISRDRDISLKDRECRNLSDYRSSTIATLEKCGITSHDWINLTRSDVSPSDVDRRKVNKYVDRLNQLSEQRIAWRNAKPLASATAEIVGRLSVKERKDRQEEILSNYRIECLELTQSKKWKTPNWNQPTLCQVERVIDGDTLIVSCQGETFTIRLIGFDAPETKHPKKGVAHFGPEASARMLQLVEESRPDCYCWLDQTQLSAGWSPYDRYGRLCAHVEMGGVLLGLPMLEGGFATLLDVFPMDEDTCKAYALAESNAKLSDVGMWKELNKLKVRTTPNEKVKNYHAVQEVAEIVFEEESTRKMLGNVLQDLFSSLFVKSNASMVVHSPDCSFVRRIKTDNLKHFQWTEDLLLSKDLRACHRCGGDSLLLE